MFGLGVPELVVILVIALLVFGPGKLPDLGKFLGKSLRDFRDAIEHRGDDEVEASPPTVKQSGGEETHPPGGPAGPSGPTA